MGADQVTGQDLPVRAEVVQDSGRTRITRLFLPGRTVIRKEPLGPDAARRLRHETAMLERLGAAAGVAQLVAAPRFSGSLVLADAGGTSLAGRARPVAADELVRLAVALARAVAGMHARGVMHRDITPANIVISGEGVPCLVDFALAAPLGEIRPEFTHPSEIAGTLAYLAPEATGRTGRGVDQRADLYALGATLYELATGEPPFGTGDPLSLTHNHLARVPVPPAEVNPAVPGPVSAVIVHLLEKEPDHRYQTADGLLYDLQRVRAAGARPGAAVLRVGERDVPLRLLPPSRLAGRDGEVAALAEAFEDALAGRYRGVLVGGAPGVGKTALADQLRPVVTGSDGWFVAGKFDQYRRDLEFDGVYQAFRALGRLLLAEPEDELAQVRMRILAEVGPNAGLLTATVPEFAALLGVAPEPGDPLTARGRGQRAAAAVLRAVASRKRPLVLFVDDLQWAGRTPAGFLDLVLSEEPVDGLLLVAAYRDDEVDAAHPLAAPLSRWRYLAGARHLRLGNLTESGSVTMVAEMLHADPAAAAGLAGVIEPHTSGNPYQTVELLNALRRDGLLTATAGGWRWDAAAVRAHLGQSEAAGQPAARAEAMPAPSRAMVQAMACLGGRAELSLLQAATGQPAGAVDLALAAALDDGLVVAEAGAQPAVRFRHDRIREGILAGLDPPQRRALQLALARRLAAVPELFAAAAEQYLPVADAVDDPAERRAVAGLLRRAAGQATLTGDHALVTALLTAALRLIDPGETATLIAVHTARHAALYGLGRLEEADEEYRTIEQLGPTVLDRPDATVVQVLSLTHRASFAEARGLGLGSLRELGITVPAADRLPAEADRQFGHLYRWLDDTEAADDLARPDLTDPRLLATTRLLHAILPATYSAEPNLHAWLSLEAVRIWLQHGPGRTLAGPAGLAAQSAAMRGDYAAGYRGLRRILAFCQARGYEPEASQARFLFSLVSCWFEPVESGLQASRRAREGLIAGGDLAYAGYAYHEVVYYQLDCAPSLDDYVAEAEAGLAFTQRTGNEHVSQMLDPYRWLAAVLRGESAATAGEAAAIDRYAGNPVALLYAHHARAIAAAIFGDQAGLARHTAAAEPLLPAAAGLYPTAVAHLLRGLALTQQARAATDDDQRGGLLAGLEEVTRRLAARAADAPDNFRHLLRLLEAERAWAAGDFRAAATAFDTARREAAILQRPWHRALITERAARFHLAHGLDQAGHDLLAQTRQEYAAWGAAAKAAQLDWAYPALRPAADTAGPGPAADPAHGHSPATTGRIDLLGVLSASQALSSETSLDRLHARVTQVLGRLTGATGVHLLLWSEDRQGWLQPAPDTDGGIVPVRDADQESVAPMSVLRYVQRMREPLVVADAAGDDRFARDPYFTNITCCSLLAVPVLNRGTIRAVLLLENRLLRGAFTTARLEAVNLIAGQLAVSLDNAQLYAEFRRIASEQAALRRVAMLVARGVPPQEIFAAVAREVGLVLTVDFTFLVRYDPQELEVVGLWSSSTDAPVPTPVGGRLPLGGRNITTLVWQTGQPTRIEYDDTISGVIGHVAAGDWGLRSSVGVPVQVESRPWGSIVVAFTGKERLPSDTEERLAGFTELVATAIANADAQAALTASRARVVTAADQTRRRMERDLHDGAQQRLLSLGLWLRTAQAAMPPEYGAQLDRAVAEAVGALDELREYARGLHPAILSERGLGFALETLANRSPIPVTVVMHAEGRLPEQVEVSAYYVVAESLTNAARHARAAAVSVEIEIVGDVLRVLVRDDGIGGAGFTGGTGLVGLKDRVEAIGGRIFLDSPAGAGTSLRAEIPLTTANVGITSR